jgi:hypothetical protein
VDTTTGIITIASGSLAGATGKTIYAGCEFDVPVRFGEELDENLPVAIAAYDSGMISSLPIVEIKGATAHATDYNYGGATRYTAAGAHSHSIADGRLIVGAPSGTDNQEITIPTVTNNHQLGGPYFYALHAGGSGTVTIKSNGATVKALATNECCAIHMTIDSGGSREWTVWG